MISQADLQTIATVFGKTSEELSGALTSENEVSLGLRLNGRVISQEDETALKETAVKQGKEIGYKEIAKGLEIQLEAGEKDPVIIAEKLKETLSKQFEEKFKNITPTEELKELQKKLEEQQTSYEKLKGTYENTISQVDEWKTKYQGLENDFESKELNNKILGYLPEKLKLDKEDALNLIRMGIETEKTESGTVYKRNGTIITDAVGKPETLENVVKSYVEEKKWTKTAGMGGGDTGGNGNGLPKGMTETDAYKWLQDRNIEPMSEEGTEKFLQLTSKN